MPTSLTVLVIDDNADMVRLNRMVLEMEGFNVLTALSAEVSGLVN